MTIHVDNAFIPWHGMKMCHMVSDLLNPHDARFELDTMADRIGVRRKWLQWANTSKEHYDVSVGARALALERGAKECDPKEIVRIQRAKEAARNRPVSK